MLIATARATLYSFIEAAKANGLNPHAYLVHLFEHLPKIRAFSK